MVLNLQLSTTLSTRYTVLALFRRPIVDVPGATTLAVGWASTDVPPVIVVFPPDPWRGRSRSSQIVKRPQIHEARWFGWSTYENRDGTRYEIFRPFLLPVYLEPLESGQPIDAEGIRAAIGSDLLADANAPTPQRIRRTCTRADRSSTFSDRVRRAYSGRCAVCGLNFGSVTAAHIYPVAAVDAVDEVWNGLCLCPNHHAAFDAYRLWINPNTGEIRLHPDLEQASGSPGDRAIVETVGSLIDRPTMPNDQPRPDMFQRRYLLPDAQRGYAWVRS